MKSYGGYGLVLLLALTFSGLGGIADAGAQDRSVLLAPDRSDPSSVPARDPVFRNALAAIAESFRKGRFSVKESSTYLPGARGRTIDDWVSTVAKRGARVDAIVGIQIFVSMHRRPTGNDFYIWIDATAMNGKGSRQLAKHKSRSRRHGTSPSCGRDCMLETASEKVADVAAKFGDAMATKVGQALAR